MRTVGRSWRFGVEERLAPRRDLQCPRRDGSIHLLRAGRVWTDCLVIAGEDQTLALRHRTRETGLIVPAELPSESGAVWRRHGRCEDVLTELFELPDS